MKKIRLKILLAVTGSLLAGITYANAGSLSCSGIDPFGIISGDVKGGRILLGAAESSAPNGYTINGTITGQSTGFIYLIHYGKSETPDVDSTVVKDGKFVFKGKLPSPQLYFIKKGVKDNSAALGFFLENTAITIRADIDSLDKGAVTGSASNKIYQEWSLLWEGIRNKAGVLYKRSDVAYKAKDTVTAQQVTIDFKKLDVELDSTVEFFVKKYPNTAVAAMVIEDRYISYPFPDKAAKALPWLGEVAKKSTYGVNIQTTLNKVRKTGIGSTPQITMADTSGTLVKLSDYKGKVVMVDFWASWCGPCRKENPNVVKAYKKYHDKGFEIIGVSLDTDKKAWLKAVNADGLTWTHISDLKGWKSAPVQEFGITGVPTSFIVDKDGKVIAKDLRGEDLDKKLDEVFGK
jgi:thiol-disulfide isomerase/thioredoxin